MTRHYQESDPIILGSGELYIGLAKDIQDPQNLTPEEESALINAGAIESGANIDMNSNYLDVRSPNRGLVIRVKVGTDVKFATGIMTWKMENISKFLTGSKFTEDTALGERKMVVGKDDNNPIVYLRFVHTKKDGTGELIVNMYKASFDGELSFVFEDENPVTVNYEFLAMTTNEGNYVEFVETFPKEPELP